MDRLIRSRETDAVALTGGPVLTAVVVADDVGLDTSAGRPSPWATVADSAAVTIPVGIGLK